MPSDNSATTDPIRRILDDYFHFDTVPITPGPAPTPFQFWRLQRALAAEYRRQDAQALWLQVGCEPDPHPAVLIRFHTDGQQAEDDDIIACQLERDVVEHFIHRWNNHADPGHEPGTIVRMTITRVQPRDIPTAADELGHFDDLGNLLEELGLSEN